MADKPKSKEAGTATAIVVAGAALAALLLLTGKKTPPGELPEPVFSNLTATFS